MKLLQCSNYQLNDEAVPLLQSKFQRLVMCAYIGNIHASGKQKIHRNGWAFVHMETDGAGNEARTLDLYLGKVLELPGGCNTRAVLRVGYKVRLAIYIDRSI